MTVLGRMLERRAANVAVLPQGGAANPSGIMQTSGGIVFLTPETDGPPVTHQTAPNVIAFYRACRIIAATCGAFPIGVFEPGDNGEPVPVKLRIDEFIWGMPNPEMFPMQLYELVFGHLASAGNAYLYCPFGNDTLPSEMWPVMPHRVKVGRAKNGTKVFLIDDRIPMVDISSGGEMLHIPGYGYDGMLGYNPIVIAARALGIAMSSDEYALRMFVDGSPPGGIIQTDQRLDDDQAEALRKRWEEYHRGIRNSHRVAILDSGGKYATVSIDPQTAQLLESRKFGVTEVARLMGIPPYLLADVEKSTSWGTGIEMQARGLSTFTLAEYVTRLEQAFTYKLLAGVPRYVKMNMNGMLRGSRLERYQAYGLAIQHRIMNPNEARAEEGLPRYDGGDEFLLAAGQGGDAPSSDQTDQSKQGQPEPDEDDSGQ